MSNDFPSSPEKFYSNLNIFLRSNLTVNKTFYHVCRVLCYRYLNFTTARGFHRLLGTLKANPQLVKLVQVADFEELTSIGLGRTGEMNKSIKNLTNETLWEFLMLSGNYLREFLASEHIQGDLDERIIYFLLKPGTPLSVVDFCGCSHDDFTKKFTSAVDKLYAGSEVRDFNYQITSLGLNDCTAISSRTLGRLLTTLPELQKLDLAHTSLNDDVIIHSIPHLKNLTHLSLAMCSQLTPRGIMEFFSYHPAVTDENNCSTLLWLNLQVNAHTSSWNDVQTLFLLKKLCRYGHNKTLQYLNIGGMPLHQSDDSTVLKTNYYWKCNDTLQFIKLNFPKLKSLSIKDNNIPIPKLSQFLDSNLDTPDEHIPEQQLKYLNIANNSYVNKWTIQDPTIFATSKSLCAVELSFDPWQQIEASNPRHEIICRTNSSKSIIQDFANTEAIKWKCYIGSAYGRRYWIYKVDDTLNRGDLDARGNITRYDSMGHKMIDIVKHPDFLKFAQNKIMLGCGIVSQSSVRRKLSYRDFKPQISKFFDRNGGITMGTRSPPITVPSRPPGGWRIMENDESGGSYDTEHEDMEETPEVDSHTPSSNPTRMGLYWDRSISDLQHIPFQETDADYMNGDELQRRRSQLSLLGSQKSSARLKLHFKHNRLENSTSSETFIYDPNDSTMSELYRKHLQVVDEYAVFGCIERGMYRYYSLKA